MKKDHYKINTDFSRSDLKLMLDIIHSAMDCRDISDFNRILYHLNTLLPFTYARCGFGDSSEFEEKGLTGASKMLSSFPEEWENRYQAKNYVLTDAVALSLPLKNGSLYWSDCPRIIGADKKDNPAPFKILDEAAVFGLNKGWIYSCREARASDFTTVSFGGDCLTKTKRDEFILEHIGPHIGLAIKKVVLGKTKISTSLTPREREVLSWTAAGKTAWETSQILNISQRTVEFHLSRILKKLDAMNTCQAIAIAVSNGLISY